MNSQSFIDKLLPSLLSSKTVRDVDREFEGGFVKIINRMLVIGDSMYQISNISSMEIIDLSTEEDPPFPWALCLVAILSLVITIVGLYTIASQGDLGTGIVLFSLGSIPLVISLAACRHRFNKVIKPLFALSFVMNSGTRASIHSKDETFLKQMMLVLFKVIDQGSSSANQSISFNLDQRKIHFDQRHYEMTGAILASGNVSGHIVNIVS